MLKFELGVCRSRLKAIVYRGGITLAFEMWRKKSMDDEALIYEVIVAVGVVEAEARFPRDATTLGSTIGLLGSGKMIIVFLRPFLYSMISLICVDAGPLQDSTLAK
jgi:hypothetical protein